MHEGRLGWPPFGWAWIAVPILAVLPFLFVTIPPLADAPGHLGQMAIQAASPASPLRAYYDFHWGLRLNLGTDLLVEGLRRLVGLQRAFWLVCAAIPLLIVGAVAALARRGGGSAAAARFALPFAYAYPFSFGFLNYTLGMALALNAFALWLALVDRPARREIAFWLILPALILCHATGGGLLAVMILADTAARIRRPRAAAILAFLRTLRPLLAIAPIVLLAHTGGQGGFAASWSLASKANALVLALRDQSRPLDIASIALAIAVPLIGLRLGACYGRTQGAVVAALLLLFLAMPAELNGSSYNDMRLVPPLMIAALALQDWSHVPRAWVRIVGIAGLALFASRIAVTSVGFAAYARSYAAEARALPHIAPGSRVLALVTHQCKAGRAWRTDRLDHFPVMATVEREAWQNALWDVPSIHLLQIRWRPSPQFYDDPSHYVWPAACVADAPDERRTIAQSAALLPLDKVDYLWLIQASLPPGPWQRQLVPVWSAGGSALYRTRIIRAASPAPR